jgi:hypothetical protein
LKKLEFIQLIVEATNRRRERKGNNTKAPFFCH